MRGYKCLDCGIDVPPDEAQLVDDMFDAKMKMGLGPLVEFIGMDRPDDNEDGYCASCFRKHDAEHPVAEFVQRTMLDALASYLKSKTQKEEP